MLDTMQASATLFHVSVMVLLGCGHGKTTTGSARQVAVIDSSAGTPIWMGTVGRRVLVATTHGDVGQAALSLIAIDPASGQQQQLAGSLPSGMPSLQAGTLYLAGYLGEVGTVDLASGAYTKLVDVDGAARAVVVTDGGIVVGTTGHLELYTRTGTHHTIAGSELGAPGDVDSLVETTAGAFAASQVAGTVFRIEGDHATIVAAHETAPTSLVATKTHVVWTTGEGANVGQHLVAVPLAGGPIERLADAKPPALIQGIAASDTLVACAMSGGGKGEILTVTPGSPPRPLTPAPARLIAMTPTTVFWVEEVTTGWAIRSAPVPAS